MPMKDDFKICSVSDLSRLVQEYGFLPLLKNQIPGFSVEEHTPPKLWFADCVEGPWEWKGPVIRETGCAYGKFFHGKAGFISMEWFPDFANYRRDGYDFDSRYDDGLARHQDKLVYDVLLEHPSLLSREWRKLAGVKKRGEFDSSVTRLQMLGYVTTIDFEYAKDRYGKAYGWGWHDTQHRKGILEINLPGGFITGSRRNRKRESGNACVYSCPWRPKARLKN